MVNQSAGSGAGSDVAADHLQVGVVLLDPCHTVEHAFAVAVSRVDDDHVHAGFNEQFKTFFGTGTHADRGACQQLAFAVLGGIGMLGSLDDVFDSNEAAEVEVLIDHEHAFKTVLVHQTLGFVEAGAFLDSHETIARGHHLAHGSFHTGFEAKVTVGDHAENMSAFDDRHAADAVFLTHADHVAHEHVGADRDRIAHNARFVALDLGDFSSLLLSGEILVNDADAAFLSHSDGQISFGNRVHSGGHHRKIQGNFASQTRAQLHIAGENFRVGGDEQNVVEGECLLQETHFR